MAVNTPNFATKIDSNATDFGSSIAEATMDGMAQQINYLIDSAPIGTIQAFAVNKPGVPIPNSQIWQLCDGSEITQPDSPMRSMGIDTRFTPDLTDRFLRGSTIANQNQLLGSDSGTTAAGVSGVGTAGSDNGGDFNAVTSLAPHTHSFTHVPAHYTVAYYIKIN